MSLNKTPKSSIPALPSLPSGIDLSPFLLFHHNTWKTKKLV